MTEEKDHDILIRLDTNVKHIVKEIGCVKDDCDTKMLEHNRKFIDQEKTNTGQREVQAAGLRCIGSSRCYFDCCYDYCREDYNGVKKR